MMRKAKQERRAAPQKRRRATLYRTGRDRRPANRSVPFGGVPETPLVQPQTRRLLDEDDYAEDNW
jgi:hypothetical protein